MKHRISRQTGFNRFFPALTLVLCLGLAAQAAAQPRAESATTALTLAEAVSRARAQHPLIVAAKQRAMMAEGERTEAGLRPNPSLTVSGENLPLDPPQNGFAFDRTLDWFATYSHTFETAGKRTLRLAAAERSVEAAEAEAAEVERRVVFEVKAAYQHLVMARARLGLLRESQANLNQLVRLNEVRVKEGYVAEGDLIKTRLEAQRVDYQLQSAALAVEQAAIALLRALGASSFGADEINLEPSEPFDYQPAAFSPATLEEAARRLPRLRAAEARVEQARAQWRLEQARAKPDFTASLGYKRNGPDNALFAAVTVPLPVYSRNRGMIARAEAEVAAAEAELRYARAAAMAELAAARRAVEVRGRQIEALRADFLRRADESHSVSLAAYREGAADLIVLLDAQRVRSQSQELYFQALYEYRLAVHELERAAGIERLPTRAVTAQVSEKTTAPQTPDAEPGSEHTGNEHRGRH
jgi:outer membrane protein, heavy metal efflux system